MIVFKIELDKAVDKITLEVVRSFAKTLIGYCRCIIVLQDANAVLYFGRDNLRENFIVVNEMTRDEAKQLLENHGANLSDKDMDYVFDQIGTCPQMLVDLVDFTKKRNRTLQDYVDIVLYVARADLVKFPLQDLLLASGLLFNGTPPKHFEKQKCGRGGGESIFLIPRQWGKL